MKRSELLKRIRVTLSVVCLSLMLVVTLAGGQSSWQQAGFATDCRDCWPGWRELQSPIRGLGPKVSRGVASIFINGSNPDPTLNQEHLLFEGAESREPDSSPPLFALSPPPSEAAASFRFGNATVGGRRLLTDGTFLCLAQSNVMAYMTENCSS
jgi:hypothetical protein